MRRGRAIGSRTAALCDHATRAADCGEARRQDDEIFFRGEHANAMTGRNRGAHLTRDVIGKGVDASNVESETRGRRVVT